jgi:mono/diheme cytochrome c family protein
MTLRLLVLTLALGSPAAVSAAPVDFVRDVRPIFQKHCDSCHGAQKQKSGLRLDIKAAAFKGGDSYAPNLVAGKPQDSPLIQFVRSDDENERMPPSGERLSAAEVATLTKWVEEGAVWPDGVDLVTLADKRDHWSFKPVKSAAPPDTHDSAWPRNPIDHFILARLEQTGLKPSPVADRITWLRRVSFDLVGLPPTPEQMDAFVNDHRNDAEQRVVEELLKSPRYGERWAQHWLDVVRYADTHGFEVNTERPHAWPYRDYVIAAFNGDTPYDRFIREQIAGDAFGQDAATGFLVTASVLLPGQIGQDDISKRLARQDALDEIVVNTGQTFLGLSVGCARCHDHKFDPISARDYYAMQAFFAGVEYADRELRTPESARRKQAAEALKPRVAEIERALAQFDPLAQTGSTAAKTTNPQLNEETFPPLVAKFVRFTIHDANLHPSLGLIEPCVDEFEILTDEATPRNVALASLGAKVTASGSRTSDRHRLEFIHDGQYGNARSWMSDEAGRGWVLFELPEAARIGSIRWSRDREGQLTDRLATAYTLEAGPSLDDMTRLASVPPRRAAVNAQQNTERFPPTPAQRVRFTILATNNLEPCLDELEVFDGESRNVALASVGTTVTSSGDTVVPNRHELRQVHDGRYGNSHSWMSNTPGQGWVELQFPAEQVIERVVWGRDRAGKFQDRLAVDYRVEVATATGAWRTVADSTDRRPAESSDGKAKPAPFSTAGLTPDEARQAKVLLDEKQALEAQIAADSRGQLAFAGTFRAPDVIRLLNRGDPEQPKEEVIPAVLETLGNLTVPTDAAEQQRRLALADWIASPDNPLTARVMVNRLWQGHFGTGLVETASDFGHMGTKPSHPELLDWLATEFVRSGWSVKHLHRLIVLSATYRQSSRIDPAAQALDAEVRLLWRFPSRRLESETIRDAMLSVSGRLNLAMGGRGFDLFNNRGGLSGFQPVESYSGDGLRRMIYAHKVRREREAVFGAFDCPDAGQSTARRRESTTPIQALNLFNSRFTLDESQAFAARVTTDAGGDVAAQVRRAWRLALGREPDAAETAEAALVVQDHGLPTLCRVLFNSNEFLFLP